MHPQHTYTETQIKDIGSQVLDICQRNVHRNLQDLEPVAGEIRVKELDWRTPFDPNSNSQQYNKLIYNIRYTCTALRSTSFFDSGKLLRMKTFINFIA